MPKFVRDFLERVVATYAEVFIGLLILGWADVAHVGALSVVETAAIAAVPAALSALKAFIAKYRSEPDSASLARGV